MNVFQSRVALLLLVISLHSTAFSLTLYVSVKGLDTNNGTRRSPFASLEAARDHVRKLRKNGLLGEPVEIIITEGSYSLNRPILFTPEDSGTPQSPLTIRGASAKRPVFSGGVRLPRFQQVHARLWKVIIPDLAVYGGGIQQLFVNGNRAVRARTPDNGCFYKLSGVSEQVLDAEKTAAVQKIKLTSGQSKIVQAYAQDHQGLIISIHHAWDRTRKYIDKVNTADSSISIKGKPMKPWNKLNNSAQFYLENKKEFMDSPGEFYYDPSGVLFYIPLAGERVESAIAIVPITRQLLVLSGRTEKKIRHVRFKNISFQYSNYLMAESGEEPLQAAAPTDAAIMIDHASDIMFEDCEVAHTSNNGLWFRAGCQNSAVRGSYFHDLGIGGIKVGELKIPASQNNATGNIKLDNNIIRGGGYEIPTGIGVMIFHSADNTVSHNEIADFRYSGISVGWVWGYAESPAKRNKILNNHIHHLGWAELSDMGGIYTLGRSEGTVLSGNVIHDIYSYGYGGWGLYTDEGSSGIVLENNLVYNCKNSGFHQHYGRDNLIRNNIFALQIKAQLQATRVEPHQSFRFIRNIIFYQSGKLGDSNWDKVNALKDSNIYWNTAMEKIDTAKDKHAIVADPLFKNAFGYDFHIKNTAVIDQIGFRQFDYWSAGVYGSRAWKRLAQFDREKGIKFDKMVERRLQEDSQ